MITKEHAYFRINGKGYIDYKLFNLTCSRDANDTVAIGLDFRSHYLDDIQTSPLLDHTFRPKRNDEIYVAPRCKYALDDVRKYYTIKRAADSGVCNVFSEKTFQRKAYTDVISINKALIFPNAKMIFVAYTSSTIEFEALRLGVTLPTGENPISVSSYEYYYLYKLDDCLIKLINGELKKPCIPASSLDINSENELTLDVLQLVYNVGRANYYDKDAEKNMVIQLRALNQYNWREYKGTVSLLLNHILPKGNQVCVYMRTRKSIYPKEVRELLETVNEPFKNNKDLLLAQRFVDNLLQLGCRKYASMTDLLSKLSGAHIPPYIFSKLFTDTVRMVPRTFEDEKQ